MTRKESTLLTVLMITSIILSFAAGYMVSELGARNDASLPLLQQAQEILIRHAYDPVPEDPLLEYGMIRGMLEAYGDPFTSFFEPVQHELQVDELQGSYGGIGVSMEKDAAGQLRLYPFPDGPAALAGMLNEDILLSVDGNSMIQELSFQEIAAIVRGPEGTEVVIEILRQSSGESLTFEIKREEVPLPSVTWRLAPGYPQIGLIEVNVIAESTPDEILRAAADLKDLGAVYYVLDLRGNRGGLLKSGIECARLFLKNGVIMQQQYRDQDVVTYEAEVEGPLSDLEMVVWVDQNTASAAEICAGALQMHHQTLIGTHTFGKDAIQLVFELDDGSSIQVTSAKWWFPDLEFPNEGVGLLPDVDASGEIENYIEATNNYFNLLP